MEETVGAAGGNDGFRSAGNINVVGVGVEVPEVSWLTQMKYALRKNIALLMRRPLTMLIMLLSPICSVFLAWAAGRDLEVDQPVRDECNGVDVEWYSKLDFDKQYDVPLTLNDSWSNGLAIVCLTIGPLLNACCVYVVVNEELSSHLFEVLRGLSLRDSVYWMSWYIPFAVIAFLNSIFAGIAAKCVPVHVFENTYFGGIFASLFFLQLALNSGSFFVSALMGTRKKGTVYVIIIMIIAMWAPRIFFSTQGAGSLYGSSVVQGYEYYNNPYALFWINQKTVRQDYYNDTSCNLPLMSKMQGTFIKNDEQRQQVETNEFFVGCFVAAGAVSSVWSDTNAFALLVLNFIPYFQFSMVWANFLGMTSLPGYEFTAEHASKTPEELAALTVPGADSNDEGFLFSQGTTILKKTYYVNDNFPSPGQSTCTDEREGFDFCPDLPYYCPYAYSITKGKSVGVMFLFQIAFSVLYTLLAAYCGIAFLGTGSESQKWYFPFMPSYWFPKSRVHTNDAANGTSGNGVAVNGVKKVYGAFEAVKGVTMKMNQGEVTALLGHNGAGKTTLSHILCCEHSASQGDVSVFGYSVSQDPYLVRKLVGVCKQDDYLWPNLTAAEHLELFAGLRGVPAKEIPELVQKWLESVDLAGNSNQYSSSFSGGMKRRLSVCLATIGDSQKLIVLDEPTTGMDPVSRRFVWRHVDEVKRDRVILLTTHAMEEADLLADTVAIMKKGEVVAAGTPLELKTQHGSALQFSVLVEKGDVVRARKEIEGHFQEESDWVKIDSSDAGNITVTIKKIKQDGEIDGVDVAVLTSFVTWLETDESKVSEYGFSNSSLEEVFLQVTQGEKEESDEGATNVENTKNAHETSESSEEEGPDGTKKANLTEYQPKLKILPQTRTLVFHYLSSNWLGRRSMWSWIFYGFKILLIMLMGCIFGNTQMQAPTMTVPVAFLSFILLNVASTVYWERGEGLLYYMRTQGLLSSSYIIGTSVYALIVYFVYSFLLLTMFYAMPLFREPELCGDDCPWKTFGKPRQIGDYDLATVYESADGEVVQAYFVPGNYGRILGVIFYFAMSGPGSVLSCSFLPGNKFALILIGLLVLVASVAPFAIYLTSTLKKENYDACLRRIDPNDICADALSGGFELTEQTIDCIALLMNVDSSTLCIPTYAAILPQVGVFQMLSLTLMAEIRFISDPPEYAANVFVPRFKGASCSGNSCIFPYGKRLYGLNLAYTYTGGMCLLVLGVLMAIFYDRFASMWASLQEMRSASKTGGEGKRGAGNVLRESLKKHDEFSEVIAERQCVDEIMMPHVVSTETTEVEDGFYSDIRVKDHSALPRDELPPIVMNRLSKIYPSLGGLPPKIALKTLDLHVPSGQVLGLLGRNGAGKTTALKILANAHEATSGVALVAGYDVSCEKLAVFERLGNCAQFDVVWPNLSVKEHLEFFAGLKGLSRDDARAASQEMATAVGLGSDMVYRRAAGNLSGGMRRRLSIASALLCSPGVFLLDEPTTGLDPSTRNSIWNLVNSFSTNDRAIIITTHMMIEADTLCNRIAIVSQGELKVVATQQHLKDNYGSGYLLQLNLVHSSTENQESAMAFVRSRLHEGAMLTTKQAKTLHINLPRDLDLKKVFVALYSSESRTAGINQFLLSQSSLEDVFIALGE